MKKFTKTLVAAATLALVSGPTLALADYYDGGNASVRFSGNGCKTDRENNIDVEMRLTTFGHNTGDWESSFFRFGEAADGEGPLIVSRPGRTSEDAPRKATMDLSEDHFYALADRIGLYAENECRDFGGFDSDYTQVTRFDASWAKNGDVVTVRMDAKSMYYNTNDRDRNLTVRINTGRMNLNNPM